MPAYAISYMLKETDPDLHSKFKYEAMNKGFSDRTLSATSENKWTFFILPHTTIWGEFEGIREAKAAFLNIKSAIHGVTIERYIICPRNEYHASTEKHYPGTQRVYEIQQCIAHQRNHP